VLVSHCTALQQGVPQGEISLLHDCIPAVSARRTEAFIFVQKICYKISLKFLQFTELQFGAFYDGNILPFLL
jgi:hypothetical protein